ncbi:MAG: hypothetical protein WAL64_04040 [Candidatus Dormiibacterota bacterium]
MAEQSGPGWTPPYIPWRTLIGLIARMEEGGAAPPRVDRSYLEKYSGATQSLILASLKSLDLLDENGNVTPRLTNLVEDGDNRPQQIRDLLVAKYPEIVRLGSINATQGMLEDEFGHLGVTGDTRRKAVAFYLNAAEYGGVQISRNWRVPRQMPTITRQLSARKKAPRPQRQGPTPRVDQGDTSIHQAEWGPLLVDPTLLSWLRKLNDWPEGERKAWLETFNAIFTGLYPEARPKG